MPALTPHFTLRPGPVLLALALLPLWCGTIPPLTLDRSLAFDADRKEYTAHPGEPECVFHFKVRNTSGAEVVITQVATSCGCTVARLPDQPWRLAPGDEGEITLTVDLRGRSGDLLKTATVAAADGRLKLLTLKVHVPPAAMPSADRARNRQIAAADRQAVFAGDCASCHAVPAAGLQGRALYARACGICHDAEHRASVVPDLLALGPRPDPAWWRQVIADGKPGTLMPAFALAHGGPLTGDQIESLAGYLAKLAPLSPRSPDQPHP